MALIHGGYWLPYYDRTLMDKMAGDLVGRGLAVWNLEYRRVGSEAWDGPRSTLADVLTGLSLLSTGSLDSLPEGTAWALMGHSAGGHLALCSQLTAGGKDAGAPAATISVGGVNDLVYADEQNLGGGAVREFLRGPARDVRRDFSPVDMLPPCLVNSLPPERQLGTAPRARLALVHGERDRIVPPAQSIRFTVSAACAGIPVELRRVRREGHFEILDPRSQSYRAMLDVAERALASGLDASAPRRGPLAPACREETDAEIITRLRLREDLNAPCASGGP